MNPVEKQVELLNKLTQMMHDSANGLYEEMRFKDGYYSSSKSCGLGGLEGHQKMIDFLFKKHLPTEEIRYFLSEIFTCDKAMISVVHIDELNDVNSTINLDGISCLCVYSEVIGDASLLIRLHRCFIDDHVLIERIIETSKKTGIACYIPIDDFDGWIFLGDKGEQVRGRQVNHEEPGIFHFRVV